MNIRPSGMTRVDFCTTELSFNEQRRENCRQKMKIPVEIQKFKSYSSKYGMHQYFNGNMLFLWENSTRRILKKSINI